MMKVSSTFTLPPAIRRFGRCGEWEQRITSAESEESSRREIYLNEPTHPACRRGAESTGTERVKSFVNGIVSPFAACWQPSDSSCVPSCVSKHSFQKQPAVVSPHLNRMVTYRDSRVEKQAGYPYHPLRHRASKNHHEPGLSSNLSHVPTEPIFPSRRDHAAVEIYASSTSGTTTTEYKMTKRRTNIVKPRSNDILCGRGGSSNRHLGNIHFRELVAANKQIYVGLTKKQKMLIARKIVDAIHNTGGRFVAKDLDTSLYYDIGLPRSLEKTSQGKY